MSIAQYVIMNLIPEFFKFQLYNVIVDTETTSKKILQHGQLQQRVTIIPLNKVGGRPMDNQLVHLAQKIAGADNVQPALSLIDYPEETRSAMAWIFGQIFICKDMETAKKIAFHDKIMRKCVTLEGDVVDPAGILSGGAALKTGSVLLKLDELKRIQNELNTKRKTLHNIEATLTNISHVAEKYTSLKQTFDLRNYEIGIIRQRLEQTEYYKVKEEVCVINIMWQREMSINVNFFQIDSLEKSLEELSQKMTVAEQSEKESSKRAKEVEYQLKDATNIREKQLKDAEAELEKLKKKAENSRKEWQKREQEAETVELEIKELQKGIETGKEQLATSEEKLKELQEKGQGLEKELDEVKANVKCIQSKIKEQKDIINKHNAHMQKLIIRKEDINKQSKEAELDIKKLNHEINSIKKIATNCQERVSDLVKKYEWIEQDMIYFGKAGNVYILHLIILFVSDNQMIFNVSFCRRYL